MEKKHMKTKDRFRNFKIHHIHLVIFKIIKVLTIIVMAGHLLMIVKCN
jgi:hypothetical protein